VRVAKIKGVAALLVSPDNGLSLYSDVSSDGTTDGNSIAPPEMGGSPDTLGVFDDASPVNRSAGQGASTTVADVDGNSVAAFTTPAEDAQDETTPPEGTSFSTSSVDLSDADLDEDTATLATTVDAQSVAFFEGNAVIGSEEVDPAGVGALMIDTLRSGNNNVIAVTIDPSSSSNGALTPVLLADIPAQSFTVKMIRPVIVADGSTAEIIGGSGESVTFAGTTGALKLDDAVAFTGQISGLSGSDALDLADVRFGANTEATFLGNAEGGTLTVTDGTNTANVALVGDYLSSNWDLSSDGSGGTIVVDPVASTNWQTLEVGAGGFVDGIDVAPDGTMVVRTDTYGAYIWNGTEWQQLVTSTSMPAAFMTPDNLLNAAQGVYEIQIASSNSNILYMMFEGYVFESSNKGTTWTQTAFAPITEDPNIVPYKSDGQKIAIDPENANIVYVGTPQSGLFVTMNGGASWQSVSAVPASQADGSGNYPGIDGILFDPALGVTSGKTDTIFAASYGNAVYESTNAGVSWSSIGGPGDVVYAAVSSTGVYYASDGNSLWSYAAGVWSELISNNSGQGVHAIAVDPNDPNEIVVQTTAGWLNVSYNGGATWSGNDWSSNEVSSSDIAWLAGANTEAAGSVFMDIGGLAFDPLVPNELVATGGTGVWITSNLPTIQGQGTPVIWDDQSVGIEQLVANEIIVPPGGDPVLASWDRPFFYISDANAYPSTYGPVETSSVVAGWSIDYASTDPSFLVGIADWFGTEESGYSTDGGQTWTAFPTFIPGAGTDFIGGTIAASTPENIIWAPADNTQPYYTLNGGETWNPITLPGVSSWNGFDFAYYLDTRTVTADRVLPNTFYLYDYESGLYESTNGGVSWTEVYNGQISLGSGDNAELQSVPGEAGNLFFTSGPESGAQPDGIGFYRSTNQGVTWATVANVQDVTTFGYGAPAPGQSYPSIYIVGYVNNVYGIWQSNNDAQSWIQIGTYPDSSLDNIKTISGDPNIYGQVYVGFEGSGYSYLPGAPVVTAVAATPSSAMEVPGNTITLTLTMSEVVTVTGTPTLSLNDGGTASYSGGSGTDALTFSYTVSASDDTVLALAITQVNEPNGATITDGNGNAADLTGAVTTFSGLQIDPPNPGIWTIVATPSSGDLDAGKTVTLTVNLSEAVLVAGGTPTLTLNDGGTATYTGGSGTSALTFSYTVGAGQSAAALAATAVNLNSATIKDGAGNAANLSLTGLTQTGPQIDTTTPTISSVVESPSSGDLDAGKTVTLTVNLSEAVTVAGGTPTLTLNDGGTATYTGGSGTNSLSFSYTVAAGQNTSALTATAVNLNSASIADGAGNAANLSLIGLTQTGPQIDTIVSSLELDGNGFSSTSVGSPSTNVTLTTANVNDVIILNIEENGTTVGSVSDAAGLTWNLQAVAGTGGDLLYQYYAVAPNALSADAISVNFAGTASFVDLNAFGISGANTSSPFDNTSIPGTSDSSTVSVTTSNANDLILAAYRLFPANPSAGSGWTANESGDYYLSEYQIVSTAQAGLVATVSNSGGTINGGIVDAVVAATGDPPSGPILTSVVESSSSGDLDAGKTLTLTLNLSEAVTVAGGTPTLTLNDGGIATYSGGSGTNALTFSYTVGAGQTTSALVATAVNLNSATITDGARNAANLALTGLTQTGPQIDTTAPVISAISETPSSGDLNAGKTVAYTITMSEVVTVNTTGGTPTLSLNDGGTATYVGGSGTNAITFSYTVLAGQNTPDLKVAAVNLNGAAVQDGAGNTANLSLTGLTQGSPQIDTTTPTIASEVESPSSGDLDAGKTVTLTLNLSEAVTVAGGTPTLTLNDGGIATYSGGSGTSALTFSYTVGAGQNTAALAATAVNLNTATITDGAGNAANLSLTGLTQTGPQVDTTTPAAPTITSFSPDSGVVGDGITNATVLTLTGTAVAKSTVELFDGATELGTTTTNGSGAWTYTTGTLANGSHSFTAADTDAAGNVSPASTALTVTVDTVAPTAPVISTGTNNGNGSVTLSGAAQANNTVEVFTETTQKRSILMGGNSVTLTLLGTTTANANGSWSYTTSTLANGSYGFTVESIDAAGNVSAASAALNVTVALLASAAPTITSFSPDSGVVGDGITNATVLTLTGVAVANSTVALFDGSTALGTTTANGSGAWSYTTGTLANGSHSFTATDTVSGNVSAASGALTVTVDTVAPAAPTITSFSPDSGVVGDGITNAMVLTLTGTAVANSTVELFDGATALGTTTANGSGAWTYTTGTLANGAQSFTAKAVDAAGNVSTASSALTVTVDTVAPAAPTITSFSPDSGVVGDGITNATVLTLTGTAVANSTVALFDGSTALGTTTANGSGAWTYTTGTLANGAQSFTAKAVDAAGNVSAASTALTVTVDTVAPAAPTITSFSPDSGVVGDGITNATVLTLTGTAVANSTIEVFDGSTALGTTTANGSGAWTYTTGTLANGSQSFTAKAVDAAGNVSAASTALNVTVDTVAPAAPVIAGDTINSNNSVTLSGTAAANTTVTLYDGTTDLGTTTANGSGAWNYTTGPLTSGSQNFTATATDGAGNVSAVSSALTVAVVAVAPAVPPVPVITSDSVNGNSVTLTGTAEADTTVTIYSKRSLLSVPVDIGTTQTNAGGTWSFVTGALASGSYTFFATATNTTGKTSAMSAGLDPVVGGAATSDATAASLTVNGTLEIAQPSTANVAFQTASPGELVLDQPSSFGGSVSGLGGQDAIDLPGIAFSAHTTLGYLPNSNQTGGTLSVTDGSHGATIALLGNYMASSFALLGDNHGGSMVVAEASQSGNGSLLTNPHH
jgi:hypothetical protein